MSHRPLTKTAVVTRQLPLRWPLILIMAIAAALRLWQLGSQPLWMDEIASLRNAELLTSSGVTAIAAQDHIAPLSAVFDSASIAIGGPNEFWMRLPSAIAGTLAAGATYLVAGRLLRDTKIAIGAGLFMAVAPFAVWFGQEARMYSLLLLVALAYVWVCWGLIDGNRKPWDWVLMALTSAIGLWTHHYMALLIIAFGAFLLATSGLKAPRLWLWATTQVLAVASFMPWLVLTQGQGNGTGFEKSGQLLWLPYSAFTYLAGMTLGPTARDLRTVDTASALLHDAPAVALTGLAFVAIGAVGLPALWRRSKTVTTWIALWGILPPVLAIALTFFAEVSYNTRYSITALPAVALLVGTAASRVTRSWGARLAVALTGGVVIWSLSNWYTNPRYAKDDLRSPAALLTQQMTAGDLLIVDNSHALPSLVHYGWHCNSSDVVIDSEDGATNASKDLAVRNGLGRTWLLIFRPWESDPHGLLPEALGSGDGIVAGSWPGATLIRYEGSSHVSPAKGITIGCAS